MQTKVNAELGKKNLIRLYSALERDLRCELSPSEHAVLCFIVDRTAPFGKEWEEVTLNHLTDGFFYRNGDLFRSGTGFGRTANNAALKSLLSKEFISRREIATKNSFRYSANKFKILSYGKRLTKSKAQSKATGSAEIISFSNEHAEIRHATLRNTTSDVSENDLYNYRENTIDPNPRQLRSSRAATERQGNSNKGSDKNTISRSNSKASRLHRKRKRPFAPAEDTAKKKPSSDRSLSSQRLEQFWQEYIKAHWEGLRVLPWSPKERGSANNFVKYVGEDAPKIMEWCVLNWHIVGKSKFPAKRGVGFPANPDFGFLFAFRKDFMDIYNDRDFREKIAGNKKAGLIVTLRKMGFTEEAAIAEVEERAKHDDRAAELDLWEKELKRKAKRLNAQPLYPVGMNPSSNKGAKEEVLAKANERAERRRMVPEDELPDMAEMKARAAKIKRWE